MSDAAPGRDPASLATAALDAIGGGTELERDTLLRTLPATADAEALLPHLEQALRDERDAGRRNAARSLLAAMAAPERPTATPALSALRRLATADADADVRVLAATALGECANPAAIDALGDALDDPEANVAAAAAEALGLLGSPRALPALAHAATSGDSWVRLAAIFALGAIGDARALQPLADAARDPGLAGAAADAMAAVGEPEAFPALRTIAGGGGAAAESARAAAAAIVARTGAPPPQWLRTAFAREIEALRQRLMEDCDEDAARLLGIAGTTAAADALLAAFERPELRPAAAAGIGALPPETAAEAVLAGLEDAHPDGRADLLAALPPLTAGEDVERLLPLLADADPAVRGAVVDAICRAPEPLIRPLLLAAADDPARRAGAAFCLGRLADPPCERLGELLEDDDAAVRAAAAEALGRCRGHAMATRIGERLEREPDRRTRRALLGALGAAGGDAVVERLRAALASDNAAERFAAAAALGATGAADALEPLLGALDDEAPEVQVAALRALGALGDAGAAGALVDHLDRPDRDVRRTAATALQRLAPEAALRRLRQALQDEDWEIRLAAVRTLRRIAGGIEPDTLRRIRDEDRDPLVRREAARALDARGAGGAGGGP